MTNHLNGESITSINESSSSSSSSSSLSSRTSTSISLADSYLTNIYEQIDFKSNSCNTHSLRALHNSKIYSSSSDMHVHNPPGLYDSQADFYAAACNQADRHASLKNDQLYSNQLYEENGYAKGYEHQAPLVDYYNCKSMCFF